MKQFSLQEYLENPQRKIVTRNGDKIRIICTDKKSTGYPIVALLEYSDENTTNKEAVIFYNEKGKINLCNNNVDLFFATEDEEKNDTSTTTAKITRGGTSMKQFNLQKYLENPDRKIVTRDGCKARVICTNRNSERYPVVALVQRGINENTYCYTRDGLCLGDIRALNDLFFVPEKKEGWVNIYKNEIGTQLGEIYNSKEDAEAMAIKCKTYYITTTKIEWEE